MPEGYKETTAFPPVEVDSIMEERIRIVVAEKETTDDWWLQTLFLALIQAGVGGPPGGAPWRAPFIPREGVHSCPSSVSANTTSGTLRNSRAVRFARFAEFTRMQTSQPSPDADS